MCVDFKKPVTAIIPTLYLFLILLKEYIYPDILTVLWQNALLERKQIQGRINNNYLFWIACILFNWRFPLAINQKKIWRSSLDTFHFIGCQAIIIVTCQEPMRQRQHNLLPSQLNVAYLSWLTLFNSKFGRLVNKHCLA